MDALFVSSKALLGRRVFAKQTPACLFFLSVLLQLRRRSHKQNGFYSQNSFRSGKTGSRRRKEIPSGGTCCTGQNNQPPLTGAGSPGTVSSDRTKFISAGGRFNSTGSPLHRQHPLTRSRRPNRNMKIMSIIRKFLKNIDKERKL